jgi:amino-acid N-acetyltransferase
MSAASYEIRGAQDDDRLAMITLLKACGLPTDDLTSGSLERFDLAFDAQGRLVGLAGVDIADGNALLRSVAVAPQWRGRKIAEDLVARREAAATAFGVSTVYLLTTTAADYFRRLGYVDLPRDGVPAAIAAHAQFRSLCPATARCLGKRL